MVAQPGRATAKMHCVEDADSDHELADAPSGEAIPEMIAFAHSSAERTRADHRLFVDAFRSGRIPGVSSGGAHPVT